MSRVARPSASIPARRGGQRIGRALGPGDADIESLKGAVQRMGADAQTAGQRLGLIGGNDVYLCIKLALYPTDKIGKLDRVGPQGFRRNVIETKAGVIDARFRRPQDEQPGGIEITPECCVDHPVESLGHASVGALPALGQRLIQRGGGRLIERAGRVEPPIQLKGAQRGFGQRPALPVDRAHIVAKPAQRALQALHVRARKLAERPGRQRRIVARLRGGKFHRLRRAPLDPRYVAQKHATTVASQKGKGILARTRWRADGGHRDKGRIERYALTRRKAALQALDDLQFR